MHVFYLPEDTEFLAATPAEQLEQLHHDLADEHLLDAIDRAIYLNDLHADAQMSGLH